MLSTRARHLLVHVCVYKDWPPSSILNTTILETYIHMPYNIMNMVPTVRVKRGSRKALLGGKAEHQVEASLSPCVCLQDWSPSSILDTSTLETCTHMHYYILNMMVRRKG